MTPTTLSARPRPRLQHRAPQQHRSRATRTRLLAAARRLIERREWRDISMGEIAKEGRSSIGSLYARFENKQALFDALDEAYFEEFSALLKTLSDHPSRTLKEHLMVVIGGMVKFHRANAGLIRALVLSARLDRSPAFSSRTEDMNVEGAFLVRSFLALEDVEHTPQREERISWMIFILMTMIRERILFPESIGIVGDPDDDRLKREVLRAALAYMAAQVS